MRELSIEEVEVVHGGHTPGEDGPSIGGWLTTTAAGGAAGGAYGLMEAAAKGVGRAAAGALIGSSAAAGAGLASWGYGVYAAATALGADDLGRSIGRSVFKVQRAFGL